MSQYKEYVIAAQTSYKVGIKYIKDNQEAIKRLYDNALFEFTLNVETRYISDLDDETLNALPEKLERIINKRYRYTSDSAIVYNYLTNIDDDNIQLKDKLERFLFEDKTRFSFMYLFSNNYNNPARDELAFDTLLYLLEHSYGYEKDNLFKYFKDFESFNTKENDIKLIKSLCKHLH